MQQGTNHQGNASPEHLSLSIVEIHVTPQPEHIILYLVYHRSAGPSDRKC